MNENLLVDQCGSMYAMLVFSRVLNVSIKQEESSFGNQELRERQSTIVGMGSTTLDIQKPQNFPRTQVCPSLD